MGMKVRIRHTTNNSLGHRLSAVSANADKRHPQPVLSLVK